MMEPLVVPEQFNRNAPPVKAAGIENTGQSLIEYACDCLGIGDLANSDVLDVGCGVRFTQTIINRNLPIKSYTGIDVNRPLIAWLSKNVSDIRFRFRHWNVYNRMYNENGAPLTANTPLPIGGGQSFDVIWLFSVFTHLAPRDARAMLTILRRYIRPDGRMIFSAFIDPDLKGFEDRVPDRPLLMATYGAERMRRIIEQSGWAIVTEHGPEPAHFIQSHFVCISA